MKILLLGKNGQVGWELNRSLQLLGEVIALDRSQCDLSKPETIPKIIQSIKPDIIVNAAAYTAVDKAEEEKELADVVNHISVGVLAEEAKKLSALLIHYSTDYVFDGAKEEPYTEEDEPNPQSVYGVTKFLGEKAVRTSGCNYLIFRTSWVFASRGSNFVKTMLRLASERDEIRVVADQFGAPTSAELIADVTSLCLYRISLDKIFAEQLFGTYHLATMGKISWYGFAKYVIKSTLSLGVRLRVMSDFIYPLATEEFPLPAKRPANSQLDCTKLHNVFLLCLPQWQAGVDRMLNEELETVKYS